MERKTQLLAGDDKKVAIKITVGFIVGIMEGNNAGWLVLFSLKLLIQSLGSTQFEVNLSYNILFLQHINKSQIKLISNFESKPFTEDIESLVLILEL